MYPTLLGGGYTWGLSGCFDIKCAPGCGDFCVFGTPKKQIPHIAPRWGVSGNSLTAALYMIHAYIGKPCCFNVGPASLTMGQHLINKCSMSGLCWGPSPEWVTAWDNAVPANTRHWTNCNSVETAQPGDRTTNPGIVMPERYASSQRVDSLARVVITPVRHTHTRLHNAGLILAQRLRRWPNLSPALVQCLVLAGVLLDDVIIFSHFNKSFHQRPWMGFE